jgi:3-isopropylmalate/(R)-2-methylmalate dehydratase small subunit
MAAAISANPERPVVVDLDSKTIACGNRIYEFEIDPVSRNQLLNGWDDVDLTGSYRDRIAKFSTEHRALRPWVVPARE